jgi:hypothetical protein
MGALPAIRGPQLGISAATLAVCEGDTANAGIDKGELSYPRGGGATADKQRGEFLALRMFRAAFSSFCEAKFYRAVVDTVNERVGRYLLFGMLFSADMFGSAVGE